jgi:SAM-dependent methyltransferase
MNDQVGLLSRSWDQHAEEWIKWVRAPDHQDSYLRFHRDSFLALVPPLKPDQVIIDIGCGEGRVARDLRLLDRRVLGVDLSFTMCAAAATHPDDPSAVVQANAARLPLADNSVDCAIAFMSLQDIDNMTGAVDEIARVLKDGASLAMAIVHPMYSSGNFTPPEDNGEHSFVMKRTYFQPEVLVSTDCHGDRSVTLFREHRPLHLYMNALFKAGFHVEELLELSDEDEARGRAGIPMFLDLLATRVPRPPQSARVTADPKPVEPSVEPEPSQDVPSGLLFKELSDWQDGHIPAFSPSRLSTVGLSSFLSLLPSLLAIISQIRLEHALTSISRHPGTEVPKPELAVLSSIDGALLAVEQQQRRHRCCWLRRGHRWAPPRAPRCHTAHQNPQ